jgi:hypothetical protein
VVRGPRASRIFQQRVTLFQIDPGPELSEKTGIECSVGSCRIYADHPPPGRGARARVMPALDCPSGAYRAPLAHAPARPGRFRALLGSFCEAHLVASAVTAWQWRVSAYALRVRPRGLRSPTRRVWHSSSAVVPSQAALAQESVKVPADQVSDAKYCEDVYRTIRRKTRTVQVRRLHFGRPQPAARLKRAALDRCSATS